MKALLYAAVEQAPSAELVEPEILTRYFAKFDEQFFSYCDKELTKINTFYSGKYYFITCQTATANIHYIEKSLKNDYSHVYIYFLFAEKLAEATRKYASLRNELHEAQDSDFSKNRLSFKNNILRKRNLPAKKIQELKLAFSEFYLSLILLQNYQNLNFTGFRKILKKHDKVNRLLLQMFYKIFFFFF